MLNPADFFIRQNMPIPDTCFVLMPFDEGMSAVYEHGIKPLVESLNIQCRRADEIYSAQGIMGDMWKSLQTAELVIADLTNKNPNVMYELGLCHALWKRVILLSQNKDDVPFDLKAWRVIWYDFTFAGSARLQDELKRAIIALKNENFIEAELVAMKSRPSVRPIDRDSTVGRAPLATEWMRGEIESWSPGRGFGFIRAGSDSYHFSRSQLFSDAVTPQVGQRTTFVPLAPLPNTPKPRASKIFIHGSVLSGTIKRIVEGRGYGFAEVKGQREDHNMLVLFSENSSPFVGANVTLAISDNPQGPIGMIVALDGRDS